MKKVTYYLAGICLAVSVSAQAQHKAESHTPTATAIPPKMIFKKLLNEGSLKNQEVQMVVVTFGPGESSAAHRHPIPTFGYVLEGELESTFEGKVYHYKTGDAFYEEPNGLHNSTRNMSPDKPAKLLAYFVGDAGKKFLIPEKK